MKLGRHYKGKFILTKAGRELVANPAQLFAQLVPSFLFRMDHGAHLSVVRYLYDILNLGDVHFYRPYSSCVEHHALAQQSMALPAYCQIPPLKAASKSGLHPSNLQKKSNKNN